MTIDEALTFADVTYPARPHNFDALEVLAAEVRRFRAAVEAVKALPRYGYDKVGQVHRVDMEDRWLNRDEVLAILEPKP